MALIPPVQSPAGPYQTLPPASITAAASDFGSARGHVPLQGPVFISRAARDFTLTASDSKQAEDRDGGYKNSLGIEAIAIFALITFIVRIIVDVAQRIQNGRSLESHVVDLNDLSHLVLTMINAATRLYGDASATRGAPPPTDWQEQGNGV